MDYDGDGILDVISGSYDPGDVYLFRGLGKGEYAKRELLRDAAGVPLVHHPKELANYHAIQKESGEEYPNANGAIQARVASFGSWPTMVDWDGDHDLDMLIGSFGGGLYLRMNDGTRTEPRFRAESTPVRIGAEPLRVNSHANPVAADWDADGRWDLVVSAADGSVAWYRNEGTPKEPTFGPRRELIPAKAAMKFWTQYLAPGEAPSPGVRAQICVTDYNRDGHLDLLVGDYSTAAHLRALDDVERAAFEALLHAEAVITKQMAQRGLDEQARKGLKAGIEKIAAKKKD